VSAKWSTVTRERAPFARDAISASMKAVREESSPSTSAFHVQALQE
jgi:hypothetical protein